VYLFRTRVVQNRGFFAVRAESADHDIGSVRLLVRRLSRKIGAPGQPCSALCFFSTLIVTPTIIARLADYDEFRIDLRRYLRTAWMAVVLTHPKWTMEFERDNQCCGWYNVLDYCPTKYVSAIMYNAIEEDSVEHFIRDLDDTKYEYYGYDYGYESIIENESLIESYDYPESPECNDLNEHCICDNLSRSDKEPSIFGMTCRIPQNGSSQGWLCVFPLAPKLQNANVAIFC